MGHDSERAALIYQHEARGADAAITNAIDAHVDAQRAQDEGDDDSLPGTRTPQANGTLMARGPIKPSERSRPRLGTHPLTWAFTWERVTRIELALSAWEVL
jgi:hypothetical protein